MIRKSMMVLYIALFLVLSTISGTASLTCSKCSNVSSLLDCRLKENCTDGQVCYMKREFTNEIQYSLGCINKKSCGKHVNIQESFEVSKLNSQQTSYCYECCSTDMCNKEICDDPPNSQCKDDTTVDCARLNSMFSICQVINEAKKICPRFCNLCNVVDGHWTLWTSWSSCDVTCGKGSLARRRSCTNPAPKYGGLDCIGRGTEMKPCYQQLCPVHGGWSLWESWETCSATCGVGMRKRKRSCNNPSPDRFGNHCFGDSHETELCNRGACTSTIQKKVAFHAYTTNSNAHYVYGTILVFPVVTLNDGQGYNPSTGTFKAPVTGVYQFIAHVCNVGGKTIVVAIFKGVKKIAITTGFEHVTSYCSTVSVISRVDENETVCVKAQWSDSHLRSDTWRWPSFSGYLLYQDD